MPILEGRVGTSPLRADVEHAESSCPHRCERRAANWAGMPPPGMILMCFAVISGIRRPSAKQREDKSVSVHHYCFPWEDNSVSVWEDKSVSVHHYCFPCRQFGVGSSLLLPLHQVGDKSVSVHHYCFPCRQFGVGSSLLLPLHQVGKLDSWEDFQDRQAMTLFTTRSTAGTTEPMSSAPTANGICSLAISPAPRHGTLSRSSATA